MQLPLPLGVVRRAHAPLCKWHRVWLAASQRATAAGIAAFNSTLACLNRAYRRSALCTNLLHDTSQESLLSKTGTQRPNR